MLHARRDQCFKLAIFTPAKGMMFTFPLGRYFHRSSAYVLIRQLNALSAQQLNMLIFALNPPPGAIPPMPAAQGDRTFALLSWAEGPGGGGALQIQQVLDAILNPR